VADRVVQTSTRALGRWADRTGRLDREVGDSSIGAMDAEVGMEQNGDKNDTGTVSHYPGNYYVDSPPPPSSSQMLHSRLLDREGEGRKAMGDWLHDKLSPWKALRRLLQTNSGTFPCESRKPARGTTGHLQSSVCRLQVPAATGAFNQCFQQVQEDMSKARSVCKDWDFVSKGTEISVGRFFIEYFTPLTLGEQHQDALSDEDVTEVWLAAKSEAISKVRRTQGGAKGAEAHSPDEKEVERPSGSVIIPT
jgi:hypothetical protein